MQTIQETLFANRKTKEKNAPSNLRPNSSLRHPGRSTEIVLLVDLVEEELSASLEQVFFGCDKKIKVQ
jgi:hypothetical protein